MGCGTSKSDVIKSATNSTIQPNPNKFNKSKDSLNSENSSAKSDASTIPFDSKDSYQNQHQSYQNGMPKSLPPLKSLRSREKAPHEPIAFEVPAADPSSSNKEDLIKKHPPRRLRQLEDEGLSSTTTLTQEDIKEKVALANERRNKALSQRVASARQKSARGSRGRKPVLQSEHYDMAELENEMYGGNNNLGFGGGDGDFP